MHRKPKTIGDLEVVVSPFRFRSRVHDASTTTSLIVLSLSPHYVLGRTGRGRALRGS